MAPTSARLGNLLLVDDDRLILSTVAAGLSDAGYEVISSDSVESAELMLSNGFRPDLVLLDLNMPAKDGFILADTLRELDNIPFVVFSAYSDPASVEKAKQAGASGYLVKPLDVRQIIPAIEAALARDVDLTQLRERGFQLQSALDAERDIRVAVGIIMMQRRLDRVEAYKFLRSAARSQRRKLTELTQEVIEAIESLHKIDASQEK